MTAGMSMWTMGPSAYCDVTRAATCGVGRHFSGGRGAGRARVLALAKGGFGARGGTSKGDAGRGARGRPRGDGVEVEGSRLDPLILQCGSAALRQRSAEVDPEDIGRAGTQALIDKMIAVMRRARGVGLAAPQIGVLSRVVVCEERPDYLRGLDPAELRETRRVAFEPLVLINPVLEVHPAVGTPAPARGRPVTGNYFEGCLSVHGCFALVPRALRCTVRALDRHGAPVVIEASGWKARILQHEVDHLNGTLFLDRMHSRTFTNEDLLDTAFIPPDCPPKGDADADGNPTAAGLPLEGDSDVP